MNVSIYPGCSAHGTAKGYDQSIKAVSDALGVQPREMDDWSCCGATSAHAPTLSSRSRSRPGTSWSHKKRARRHDALRGLLQPVQVRRAPPGEGQGPQGGDGAIIGAKITDGSPSGTRSTSSPSDIGLDAIHQKVIRSSRGSGPCRTRAACSCGPPEVCGFDDFENPVLMDRSHGPAGPT